MQPGDEVIAVAAGFPSTVAPIIQNNMVPVFVDVDIPTYNTDDISIKKGIVIQKPDVFSLHIHLGNPFKLDEIMHI